MKGICYMSVSPIAGGYNHHEDVNLVAQYIQSLQGFSGKAHKTEVDASALLAEGFLKEMVLHLVQDEEGTLNDETLHVVFLLSKDIIDDFSKEEIEAVARGLTEGLIEPFGGEIGETIDGSLGPCIQVIGFDRELYFKTFEKKTEEIEHGEQN